MNYHSELPARVRQANADELLRLRRLYPRNARVQVLVREERARRRDRPKST